ncbi:hypothetical protein [Polynucleobacter sp. Fuers-14]|uniref:hypothetical protein n=1 Tax=Polynucleobacter sp. Fuers-14 TaxID=1758364 RepID=UPI001C0CA59D|nr:hypothetical protein [Polynucleobacter sp. Fuers-14]MBU3640581.1 hypothetical protein [Polynucleobacter sp. Fuers-14]
MMKFLVYALLTVSSLAMAGETVSYQSWIVELNGKTNEAHTVADANTSLGLFCSGEQCLFYLHQSLNCTPGAKYSVLMNSPSISTALSMECTLINGNVFQILTPFNAVLKATQAGEVVGFAVALQSGAFAVTQFSLAGAKPAIERVLNEAANSQKREQLPAPVAPPQIIILPPIQIAPQAPQTPKSPQIPGPNQNVKPGSNDISI